MYSGLSADDQKILAEDERETILCFGNVAFLNSSGTKIIFLVKFQHFSSTYGPEKHCIHHHSCTTLQPITFGSLEHTDPETFSQNIKYLDTSLSFLSLILTRHPPTSLKT